VKPVVDPRTTAIANAVKKGGPELARLLSNKAITKDTYGITQEFNRLLGLAGGNVPKGKDFNAAKVGSYYNYEDLFNKAFNTATDKGRNTVQAQYQAATPYNWQQSYFADTADDPILQSILGQQYGEMQTNLQRQLDRGTISQGAYDYAMQQLGNNSAGAYTGLASGAYDTLQNIGGGVLSGYRTGLTDTANQFNTNQVQNFKLGDVVAPDALSSTLHNQAAGYTSGMEGSIRTALGNTQLFDPNALVSKAGSVVGPSNQPVTGGNAQGTGTALTQDEKRTTGTSGVF
jgi:hypothetical protein